ncbi:hypothetical protein [Myxococcus fulvus]|uniref:hypothetical protein n=1 Tax=Myxococcus fulvus TaxID=33 RepID=UPI0020BE15F7|nr:hypothetical protein [Myxococcus fulvus]MCK8504204.1 hypothetical protein [Myxococcus fulvus]
MSVESPDLNPQGELAEPKGPKQAPSPQLLFRIVAHAFVVNGVPTADAFKLRVPGDKGLLSVDLESQTSAQAAYTLRAKSVVEAKRKPPAGVWAVSVNECSARNLDAYSDPRDGNAAHGGIDFRALASESHKALRRALEKELLDCALARKAVYIP